MNEPPGRRTAARGLPSAAENGPSYVELKLGVASLASLVRRLLGQRARGVRRHRLVAGLSRYVHTAVGEISQRRRHGAGARSAATPKVEIVTLRRRPPRALAPPAAHKLYAEGVALIVPRWISQFNRFADRHRDPPGASIGHGLFIDHGSGVVIGETAEIGDNVTIYQGVTLGGTGKETGKRHPTVGDNVIFGAGSQVLGAVKVGDNAKVGAGSVVVTDVPKNSTVVGNPGRPVLLRGQKVGIPDIDYRHLPDPVAEAIKCLVARIVEMEKELDEIDPERSGQRAEGRARDAEDAQRAAAVRRGRRGSEAVFGLRPPRGGALWRQTARKRWRAAAGSASASVSSKASTNPRSSRNSSGSTRP